MTNWGQTPLTHLSKVAYSGNYWDLINCPEIGDGSITIYQGDNLVDSFSVNQKEDKTIRLSSGIASVSWGDILGDITNQGDLMDELDSKIGETVLLTWSELKELRDGGDLVAGASYRITDYSCNTVQEDTTSAGNVFDIIVTAISDHELSEDARAIQHTTNQNDYFHDCDLSAWRLKYCLDNDFDRFAWIGNIEPIDSSDIDSVKPLYEDLPSQFVRFLDDERIDYADDDCGFWYVYDGGGFRLYGFSDDGGQSLNQDYAIQLESGTGYFSTSVVRMTVWGDNEDVPVGKINGEEYRYPSKGVIYQMIDEWGNDCPYDFKNIMFKRYRITSSTVASLVGRYSSLIGSDSRITVDTQNPIWSYTFCMVDTDDDSCHDLSVEQERYCSDEGYCEHCYCNTIEPLYYAVENTGGTYVEKMSLPNNVFVTDTDVSSGGEEYYGIFRNNICGGCLENTFGNSCSENTVGSGSYRNVFSDLCSRNSFGKNSFMNIVGERCSSNTFTGSCHTNTIAGHFYENIIGCSFQSNTITGNFYRNRVGHGFESNTITGGFYRNTIGNRFRANTIQGSFIYSTVGNYCRTNSFSATVENITIFDNVSYCNVTGLNGDIKNVQILNGTSGISPSDLLVIPFETEKDYTQIAALREDTSGQLSPGQRLVIWDAAAQDDWEQSSTGKKDYIKNKPSVKSGAGADSILEGNVSGNKATGSYSHAEGDGTTASNSYEHAQGTFNVSNKKTDVFGSSGNTIHSIGIGSSANSRKNAVEVMQNGDIYICGLGGYDGTTITNKKTLQDVIDGLGTVFGGCTDVLDGSSGIVPVPLAGSQKMVLKGSGGFEDVGDVVYLERAQVYTTGLLQNTLCAFTTSGYLTSLVTYDKNQHLVPNTNIYFSGDVYYYDGADIYDGTVSNAYGIRLYKVRNDVDLRKMLFGIGQRQIVGYAPERDPLRYTGPSGLYLSVQLRTNGSWMLYPYDVDENIIMSHGNMNASNDGSTFVRIGTHNSEYCDSSGNWYSMQLEDNNPVCILYGHEMLQYTTYKISEIETTVGDIETLLSAI